MPDRVSYGVDELGNVGTKRWFCLFFYGIGNWHFLVKVKKTEIYFVANVL